MDETLRELHTKSPPEWKRKPFPVFRTWALKHLNMKQIRTDVVEEVRVMYDPMVGYVRSELNRAMQQIGILSLASRGDSPTMWSYYAQNHEGFVIGFAEAHPWFDRRATPDNDYDHLRRVLYEDPPDIPRALS